MKIIINATVIRSEGGVTLLQELLRAFKQEQIVLYLNPELTSRVSEAENLEIITHHPGNGIGRFLWEQFSLPFVVKKHHGNLLLSFGNTGPLFSPCPQVLYVQQSIPYTHWQPSQNRLRWHLYRLIYGFLMGLAQLGATRIIIPTAWLAVPMRRSVFALVPPERYMVSPPGLPQMLDTEHELSEAERELLARAQICKSAGNGMVFYPAYLAPYKNIPELLEAFSQLAQLSPQPCKLWLTFDQDSPEYFPCKQEVFETLARLDFNESEVVLCGSLSKAAVNRMYALSDVLVFPSLVETLGLPLQEALALSLPIVACDTPFAREICGEAALYAPAESPAALARQLFDALKPEVQQRLKEQARVQAARFCWDAHARDILGLTPG